MANIPYIEGFHPDNVNKSKGNKGIFVYYHMVYKEHNLKVLSNHYRYTIYCPQP